MSSLVCASFSICLCVYQMINEWLQAKYIFKDDVNVYIYMCVCVCFLLVDE